MTKIEMFKNAISIVEFAKSEYSNDDAAKIDEVIEGLNHEIELLQRKAATPRKPTANQIENETIAAEIVAHLVAVDMPKSIKEMQDEIPALAPLSNQRISHILSALKEKGKIEKSYVKKTPYFNAI